VVIILWIVLLLGAFIFNLLGLMNLVPRFVALPFFFIVLYILFYNIFQKNSYRRFK